jgi:hypothetical protein
VMPSRRDTSTVVIPNARTAQKHATLRASTRRGKVGDGYEYIHYAADIIRVVSRGRVGRK